MVGIVVDGIRPDYIHRFWDDFSDGGFKRLVKGGHTFRNASFSYIQTNTGLGHATNLTGATPSIHGIIGNGWYSRELDRGIGGLEPVGSGYHGVGTLPDYAGSQSPANLLVTTVGDELYFIPTAVLRRLAFHEKTEAPYFLQAMPARHSGMS